MVISYCFLNTIQFALYRDYDKVLTIEEMICIILAHIVVNIYCYKRIHTGEVLIDAESYFTFGACRENVIDNITIATANEFHLHISIYQKCSDETMDIIQQSSGRKSKVS